ncbi:extracellular solute-binding protein [Clostridium sp. YIM B02505]|uniref:Extracellular solute-binding protein n=1 Tax=Clostridium yunnanense TaxID=2800325 RepID=A0ABS1EKG3_9CLOT|nr:extracellular solute-binding protein [Clostridium yunnanense]MBK1809846.1 extracellular solute-binding protein [Clostridium yunnanense]
MRKKLLRAIMLMAAVTVSTGLFIGCSKDEKNESKGDAKPTTVDTLTVWSNNAATKNEDEKVVEDFNNGIGKEKGIKIEYKIYGSDYSNVLSVALAGGQGPNLFKVPQTNLAQYATVGYILPLEDLPGGKDYLKTYGDSLQAGYNKIKGKTYTVPQSISTLGVAYNKDLLKKNGYDAPPKTWAELEEMAKTITKNGKGKEFGFVEGLKSTGYASVNGLWQYAASLGHNEYDQKAGSFDFSSMKPFVERLASMKKQGVWFPGSEGLNNDAARAQFAEGNIGFKLSASWDAGVWQDQFPAKMNWGICRPVEDTSKSYKDYTYQTFSFAIGAKSKGNEAKALEVLKAFTSDDAATKLYEAGKAIPYKADLIKNSKNKPKTKNFDAFADLSNAYQYPLSPKGDIKLEGDTIENVLMKIIVNGEDAGKALADVDKRYNDALKKAEDKGLDINQYIDKTDVSSKK